VARHCREAGKKLRVLWLDAHADFNTSVLTPSGNIHGMPVACLCGHGPRAGRDRRPGAGASTPRWCARSASAASTRARSASCTSRARGLRHALHRRDGHAPHHGAGAGHDGRHTHLHVSFDVDFLDPEIAPGVGTTVPGGPTYREAQLCMEMIADTGRLASLDVMELNPALDLRNKTADAGRGPDREPVRQEHADARIERLDAEAARARCPVLRAEGLLGAVTSPKPWTSTCTRCTRASCAARGGPAPLCCPLPSWRALRAAAAGLADARWPTAAHSHADTLVNAAGAWADEVAGAAACRRWAAALRRSAFIFDAPGRHRLHARWPAVCGGRRALVLQARRRPAAGLAGQRRPGAAARRDARGDSTSPPASKGSIAQHTTLHPPPAPHLGRPAHLLAGRRAGDRLRPQRQAGFFWLAGQGGYGIQSAAGAGALAAALLRERPLPSGLAAQGVDPVRLAPARLR
jgi:glycine/D-amino acid oxidase-like deaminating enzyme